MLQLNNVSITIRKNTQSKNIAENYKKYRGFVELRY